MNTNENDEALEPIKELIDDLRARIAELEAERDRLREALESLPHEQDCASLDNCNDECDCIRAALAAAPQEVTI